MIVGKNVRITQMLSAAGWYATYDDKSKGALSFRPLVAWLLTDEVGKQDIIGLVGGDMLLDAEVVTDFYGYFHESELDKVLESYSKLAELRQKRD